MSSTKEEDRISALPDEIILHILSFTPTKFAVRTSILSNRWRHLWKFSPAIYFHSLPCYWREPVDHSFVNRCLELHRATELLKFRVVSNSCPDFQNWVDFAIARNVQELVLGFTFESLGTKRFQLQRSFYANTQSIKCLWLSCFAFSPPRYFMGFANLRILSLCYSVLSDKVVKAILSKCPLLESLTLDECFGLINVKIAGSNLRLKHFVFHLNMRDNGVLLEIDVPTLVSLKYVGSWMEIQLKSSASLLEAAFFFWDMKPLRTNAVECLMSELCQLTILSVDSWFVQFMAKKYYMKHRQCISFQSLKKFRWCGPITAERDLISLVAFLGDCPALEEIKLDFRDAYFDGFREWRSSKDVTACFYAKREDGEVLLHGGCLYQLKIINVCAFSGYKGEMELVIHLLQKAVVLQMLSLTFGERKVVYGAEFEVDKQLLQEEVSLLPRASSHA